jgi:hypothetical protein
MTAKLNYILKILACLILALMKKDILKIRYQTNIMHFYYLSILDKIGRRIGIWREIKNNWGQGSTIVRWPNNSYDYFIQIVESS